MRVPALSPEQADEARLLFVHHGWMVTDLMEHFGVSKTAVATALGDAIPDEPPPLRVKQCARCLHFLPLALFSGRDATRTRLASWCASCTNQPADPAFDTNPQPLAHALANWRTQ